MSDLVTQRALARGLEQTRVVERPGGVAGFDTFYAAGTFVPTFAGTGTVGVWTYNVQTGFYTRIGDRVFFSLSVNAATRPTPPTGNATIAGLPFTSSATANSHSVLSLSYDALTLSATIVQLVGQIQPSSTQIQFLEPLGTAPVAAGFLLATGLTATAFIRASGFYMV